MEAAEKLSVTVTPAMARLIRERVEDGSFGSASEVIRAALRAFQREENEHAERLASIKARIRASVEDARPDIPADRVIGELKAKLAQLEEEGDEALAGRLRRKRDL